MSDLRTPAILLLYLSASVAFVRPFALYGYHSPKFLLVRPSPAQKSSAPELSAPTAAATRIDVEHATMMPSHVGRTKCGADGLVGGCVVAMSVLGGGFMLCGLAYLAVEGWMRGNNVDGLVFVG